ncbi:unnamed protein product [Cylicocyclus nassatus]|uniref:Uncharacterized protein n=1 Tax=Cylicocyclus nassatus TaxID=53992 RepID=A0AA36DLK7_CYLNA|nr:unnamed protein product [Cylicocyclus nassatus]
MEIDMDAIKLKSKPAPFFRIEYLSKVNVTNQIEADPYAQTERSTTSTSTNQSTTKPPPSTTTFPATNPPPKKTATTATTPRPTITPPAVTKPPVVIPSYVQSISKAKSLDPIELHITTITTPTTTPATQPKVTTTPVRTTTVRLFCTSRAEEMTYSSVLDAYEATVSPLMLMDNVSNTVSPMTVERIARGKTILQKLKSHIFGPDEEVHESDLICNCNGALCDNKLVHLLGESYKGKCRAKRGRCFKVYDEEHDNHMSMGWRSLALLLWPCSGIKE